MRARGLPRIGVLVCFAFLAAGCGSPYRGDDATGSGGRQANQPRSGERTGREAMHEELLEADRAFARATAERRLSGWVESFSADGRMILPGGSVTGHVAIRDLMAPLFADSTYTLSWVPEFASAAGAGDLGYTVGRYESHRTDPSGEVIRRSGRYLSVWRRQPDGTWTVEADIGNLEQNR